MTNYQIESREWWVQKWLELLDSYRFKKRLERARNYAREGNVLSIDFVGAQALATVQGSEAQPYQVSLSLDPFTDEDWDYIIETMSQKAIFSAQLLAGQMPENIEEVFQANGLRLFPFTLDNIQAHCSCPDKANPCKHIGAVYYQLGDRFSEDPFVLFQLRGRTKNQILEALRQKRNQTVANDPSTLDISDSSPQEVTDTTVTQIPTSLNFKQFWQYNEPLESSLTVIVPPTNNQTILELLGTIPLAYADAQAVEQYLEQVYATISQQIVLTAFNPE